MGCWQCYTLGGCVGLQIGIGKYSCNQKSDCCWTKRQKQVKEIPKK